MKKKAENSGNRGFIDKFCIAQEGKAKVSLILAAVVVVATIGSVCAAAIRSNSGNSVPSENMELNAAEQYLAQAAIEASEKQATETTTSPEVPTETSSAETRAAKRGGLTGDHVVDVGDLQSLSDEELVDAILSGQAGVIDRSDIETDQSQNEDAGHTASGGDAPAPTDTPTPTPEPVANTGPEIKLPSTSFTTVEGQAFDPLAGVSARTYTVEDETNGISYVIKDSNGDTVSLETAQNTAGKYSITYSYELIPESEPREIVDYELGIDISEFQGSIDWYAVKADGIDFAFIRCGGRGYSKGGIYDDSRFYENVQGAKAAGIKVGVYFFSQAITPYEALEEASITLDKISGLGIDMPVVMDWETGGGYRTWDLYGQDFANVITAFCSTIAQNGYTPCVYLNTSDINSRLGGYSGDILSRYKLWYAYPYSCYSDGSFYQEGDMIPPRSFYFEYWQYSWHGDVAGISYDTDLNIRVIGKTTVTDPANVMTATAEWEVTASPDTATPSVEPTAPSDTTPDVTDPTDPTNPTESSDATEPTPEPTGESTDPEGGTDPTSGDTPAEPTGEGTAT